MKSRINPFIRAHGATPGPLMRPLLTGFLSGQFAALIVLLLWLLRVQMLFPTSVSWTLIVTGLFIYGTVSGLLYGRIYRRAANDLRGGWIFGASTGFILWTLNPLIWIPWFGYRPLFVGHLALEFMLAHVIHGTLLGIFYPWVHFHDCRELSEFSEGPSRHGKNFEHSDDSTAK